MKKCIVCNKEIVKGKRSKKQHDLAKYCSKKCFADDKRIEEVVVCLQCGKEVVRKKRSDSKSKYCSVSCAAKNSIKIATKKRNFFGENNPAYKNGKTIVNQGYIRLNTENNILEHRFVMQKYLGRKLKKNEVIHHVNGNKTDNRIENLEVMTQSEHVRLHISQGDMEIFYAK